MSKNKEEIKLNIGIGYHSLIDLVYSIAEVIPFVVINDIIVDNAMLKIIFEKALDKPHQYVLDCIAYKIERESAKICEDCGAFGVRRLNLPNPQSLCVTHYTLKYNAFHESVPPKVANQEPLL